MSFFLALRNRQRTRTLDLPWFRQLALQVLRKELKVADYELAIHFVDAAEMARLNWKYLRHEGSTDVITFDYNEAKSSNELHGEIFISIPDAVKQARQFRTKWQSEVLRYIIHGLLHLSGFDDTRPKARRVMKREENRLLRQSLRLFPTKQSRHADG